MQDVTQYVHCRRCLMELPAGASPRDHVRLEAGITPDGVIKIFCVRHELPVVALPLEKPTRH